MNSLEWLEVLVSFSLQVALLTLGSVPKLPFQEIS